MLEVLLHAIADCQSFEESSATEDSGCGQGGRKGGLEGSGFGRGLRRKSRGPALRAFPVCARRHPSVLRILREIAAA